MTTNPIEQGWQKVIEENNGFCCEGCRSAFRALYFAGAMDAMVAIAGFDPNAPHAIALNVKAVASVTRELSAVYHAVDAASPGMVRH